MLTLYLLKRRCDRAVQRGVLQSPQQESLKDVDAAFRGARAEVVCHERIK